MTRRRFSRLVLLAGSSLAVSAGVSYADRQAPPLCSGSLFGPETFRPPRTFVSNQGMDQGTVNGPSHGATPIGTRRMISLQGHTPPFRLRARSGDGGSRVSTAWVWLDRQLVLGPADFSRDLPEYERVVAAREGSALRVQIVDPDGTLSIEIVGERPDTEQIVLTPDGGHYDLKSGAALDVPPGAVGQETRIAVCGVSASSAQPRLDAVAVEPLFFAAGIQGVPSGLTFNVPLTITVPAAPRRSPDDIPVALVLEPSSGALALAATDLQHDPTKELIRARVSHFTKWMWAFAKDEDLTAGYDCTDKANWCRCYGLREVIESNADSTTGDECYEVSSDLLVTLLECPGQPQQSASVRAKEIPSIRIDPDQHPIKVSMCHTGLPLTAVGIHTTEPRERPVLNLHWTNESPEIVSLDPSGVVHPHADGCTARWSNPAKYASCGASIWAQGSCGALQGTTVEVIGPQTVDPLATPPTLVVGGTHTLTTLARDINGAELGCEPIVWSSSNDKVVTVAGGNLVAIGPGEAVITARAKHNLTAEKTVVVKVRPDDDCDSVPCTLKVQVAVQPPVQRCSGTADACVYTGDGQLYLAAWMEIDATAKKVKRELAWAASSLTGSVELGPAYDPDPAVTRVQVKGFVPGMVTMQALDPSSTRSATLKVHVVPWLFQATATSSAEGEDSCGYPAKCGRPEWICYSSGETQGQLSVRLPGASGPLPAASEFEWTPLSGYVTTWGPNCYKTGTQEYLAVFSTSSPVTVSGSTVSYHWEWDGPCYPAGAGTMHKTYDLSATFDDTGMTGTYTSTWSCSIAAGITARWGDTLPFQVSAVAVQPPDPLVAPP